MLRPEEEGVLGTDENIIPVFEYIDSS